MPDFSSIEPSIVYSYIIYKNGSNYIAFNTVTKTEQFSNTAAETTFNSVIDAMNTAGGGKAFVKNGLYLFTGPILPKAFTGLIGENNDKTIFRNITNAADSSLFRYWAGASSTLLESFTVENIFIEINNLNGNGTGESEVAWLSSGTKNCVFRYLKVKSFSTPASGRIGFFIDTANRTNNNENLTVEYCTFDGPCGGQDFLGTGMLIDSNINHNYFKNCTSQAIGVGKSLRTKYNDNTFNTTGNVIGLENDCQDNEIKDNICYITGGIKLSEEGSTATNISRNNTVDGNMIMYGSGGIECGISINDTIINNVIYRTARNGIRGAFNGTKIANNHLVDTNFDNNSQTINGSGRTVGGIVCINNATPLPDCDNNVIENNSLQDTGVAFTDPVSATSKNGNTGGIILDTDYNDNRLSWNNYAGMSTRVLDFGTNTARTDVDDDRTLSLMTPASIKVRGNDGLPITFLNFNGQTSPSQTLHFFPDYTKQVGATAVELLFGYNSDLTNVNFYSKWSGSNKEFFKLDAVAGDIKLNALTRVGDVDINYLLRLYRTTNTVNNETSLAFDLRNASNTQTEYASIAAEIITNTAGDEDGQIRFKTRKDGATNTKMILNKDGFLSVGGNLRLGFDDTGLTAFRAFTFPDLSGQLAVSGVMLKTGYLSVTTSPVTLSATTDQLVKVDASGGVRTVNLPAASGNSGLFYTILKSDSSANAVTIDGNASETINGSTTFLLTAQYQSVTLRCDGANWFTQPNSTERTGKALASGNGSTTLFNIAHGLGATPSNAMISVSKPSIARTYTVDSTNIAVTFDSAPANASNNVEIYWRVVA
jgi:hypothetical protein